MSEEINEFPPEKSWEERSKLIQKINSLNLATISIQEVTAIFGELIDGLSIITMPYPIGINLFRAIKYDAKPKSREQIIYPPKDKAKINRASEKGEQMFYCATVKKTLFYELDCKIGEKYVISNWCNNKKLLLQNVGYSNLELKTMGRAYNMTLSDKHSSESESENNSKTNAFIKEAFSKRINSENDYKLTIGIAKILFKMAINDFGKPDEFDGMIYHTIRMELEADNIVLKPSVIDNGVVYFQNIEYIEIMDKSNDKYIYRLLDFADSIENGIIQWRDFNKTWLLNDESDDYYFVDSDLYTKDHDLILPEE